MNAGSLDLPSYLKFSPSRAIKIPNEQKTQTKPLQLRVGLYLVINYSRIDFMLLLFSLLLFSLITKIQPKF